MHYDARQFVTLLNDLMDVNSWVRILQESKKATNIKTLQTKMIPKYHFFLCAHVFRYVRERISVVKMDLRKFYKFFETRLVSSLLFSWKIHSRWFDIRFQVRISGKTWRVNSLIHGNPREIINNLITKYWQRVCLFDCGLLNVYCFTRHSEIYIIHIETSSLSVLGLFLPLIKTWSLSNQDRR